MVTVKYLHISVSGVTPVEFTAETELQAEIKASAYERKISKTGAYLEFVEVGEDDSDETYRNRNR